MISPLPMEIHVTCKLTIKSQVFLYFHSDFPNRMWRTCSYMDIYYNEGHDSSRFFKFIITHTARVGPAGDLAKSSSPAAMSSFCTSTTVCNTSTMQQQCMCHYWCYVEIAMMTSSNGKTGPLCGEFTGHRWIFHTKASDAELWCFLWSKPE